MLTIFATGKDAPVAPEKKELAPSGTKYDPATLSPPGKLIPFDGTSSIDSKQTQLQAVFSTTIVSVGDTTDV